MLNKRMILCLEDNEPLRSPVRGHNANRDNLTFFCRRDHHPEMEIIFLPITSQERIAATKHKFALAVPRHWQRKKAPESLP